MLKETRKWRQENCRAVTCTLAAFVLTPLLWISGPIVWDSICAKLFTREGALSIAALVLALSLLESARPLAKGVMLHPLTWIAVLVCLCGKGFATLPPMVQACIVPFLMIVVGRRGLWPIFRDQGKESDYPKPAPDQLRRYPLIRGLMRAVMAGATESGGDFFRSRINRIALTGPWGCGKTLVWLPFCKLNMMVRTVLLTGSDFFGCDRGTGTAVRRVLMSPAA